MSNVKKKNYTLFVNFRNMKIKVKTGSIRELDDLTSYFKTPEALAKMYLKDLVEENDKYTFYIESAKSNAYGILLNDCRFILNKNINWCVLWLKTHLQVEELISYIENNTKIFEYLESDKSQNIPLCKLYNLLIKNNKEYLKVFENMLQNDYIFYRNIVKRYKAKIDSYIPEPILKEQKEKITLESKDIYKQICSQINRINISDKNQTIIVEGLKEEILNIINRCSSDTEMLNEIELFVSESLEMNAFGDLKEEIIDIICKFDSVDEMLNEIDNLISTEKSNNEVNHYEEEILDIINKCHSTDEILNEIESLVSNEDERNHYLKKYKSLIYTKYN